jgi:hypothetical protein
MTDCMRFVDMDEDRLRIIMQDVVRTEIDRAFKSVGLHDDDAGDDIRDLRSLITDWRETKKTIWNTVARWGTLVVLGLLTLGAWSKINGAGGSE